MKKRHDILIIDDEQVVIDAVTRICTEESMQVDAASDAREALDKAAKNRYRLIICDIMLPGMDGFQLLEKLRPIDSGTAFIMTTGYTTIENAVKSLYQGAVNFLPKPFTSDEFCSTAKRSLNYISIREKLREMKRTSEEEPMLYVPCPAKYFRLGYSSWMVQDHDGSARIGVTDLYLKTVDTVGKLILQAPEQQIFQGNSCAILETKDGLPHNITSPLSGRILEKNIRIEKDLTLLEKDPFFDGWLYRVLPEDIAHQLKYLIPGGAEEI